VLPALDVRGARHLALSFLPAEGHEVPTLHVREDEGAPWRPASLAGAIAGRWIALRILAARDPLVRGQRFRGALRNTWVTTAPPEEQRVEWVFVAPSGAIHRLEARYAGDYRWEVEFEPGEVGRWRCFIEHRLDGPYRSAEGLFDVLPGDREDVARQLRDLARRIHAAYPEKKKDAVYEFGPEFWRLERSALQHETPESFRAASGREVFDLMTDVRQAMSFNPVPDEPRLSAAKRKW
jgi:hypothetical protein